MLSALLRQQEVIRSVLCCGPYLPLCSLCEEGGGEEESTRVHVNPVYTSNFQSQHVDIAMQPCHFMLLQTTFYIILHIKYKQCHQDYIFETGIK